jgi:muramoyltetrapeptide carboxypeptidase
MKHIRIISPSGAVQPDYITLAQNRLESWGFRVSISQHALGQYGRFAGTPQQRLADLNTALADPDIDIILCSRGGYGLQQIVDQIQLPMRPKDTWPLLVGFSDITVLHSLMSTHGVPSLHASMCKDLATLPDTSPALKEHRMALEQGAKYINPLIAQSPFNGSTIIGGNLSILYGLQDTAYSLHRIIDGCAKAPVLLIEDIDEQHYHVDRMLNNLRLSGVLSRLSGVIIGQFTNCPDDPQMQCTLQESINQIFAPYGYPVLFNAPYGHIDENQPIVLL